jgi:hypothetical protein
MMNSENSNTTNVMRAAPIRETKNESVRRREMIDQMEPNFIHKQIGFISDQAPDECAWQCVDRKSVSRDENTLSGFGRIALAPTDPSREQLFDRSQDLTEHPAWTAPLDRAFAPGAESNSVTDWAVEIKRLWAKGNAATLDLARVVSAAKNRLRQHYGQWSRLWKSEQKIPISKRTANMLAVIGDQMGALDSQTSANLPRGWNILYHLARLDRRTLELLIEQGFIHSKLTLREAKALIAELTGKQTAAEQRKANVRERLRRFAEFVRDTGSDWESDERELATRTLTRLIEEIGVAERAIFKRDPNSSTFSTQLCLLIDQQDNL